MTRRDTLKLFGLLGLRAALPAGVRAVEPIQPPPPNDPAIAEATAAFGCDLFGKLRAKSGNLFFSPTSIATALAMTAGGARGETLAEMNKVLHLPKADSAGVGDLMRYLQAAPAAKYELSIANALWLQQGMSFRQRFLTETAHIYGASMQSVDFRDGDKARQTINHWVEQQTKDKIKELFGPGSLEKDSRLVLTNAVYFKGKWAEPFKKFATKDEPFFLADGSKVQAPLMRQSGEFRYFAGDGLQVVTLPYSGYRVDMMIVLPAKADGLPDVEKTITADKFKEWSGKLRKSDGQVLLPRFKMTDEFDLGNALKEIGMRLPFSKQADFGAMCEEPVIIGQVVHKAYVDTNEEGTEAAAATGVKMLPMAAPPQPKQPFVFRADRPFLFVIRDTGTGTPLFVGRVANPKT
jgi:serpin B